MTANFRVGEKIENRWEIHDIKEGGMGVVYIVYDDRYERPLAAKTFRDDVFLGNPRIAPRFTEEARAWIGLGKHPNIVMADSVEQIGGKPFLFLEYVGWTLSDWMNAQDGKRDGTQILRFGLNICDGMIHAISHGVRVHRDLKPQNCLLTEDFTLKVGDFGLAKIFDVATPTIRDQRHDERDSWQKGTLQNLSLSVTQSGIAVGTPPYMSPEQFDDAARVDVRADIYALGVILIQAVTGRLPFHGTSWFDFERLHKEQPAPLLTGGAEILNPFLQRCLAKNPARRFASFNEARAELEGIYASLTRSPVPPQPESIDAGGIDLADRVVSLMNLGRLEEALTCCDKMAETMGDLWSDQEPTFRQLAQCERAIECYRHYLESNPRDANRWFNRGVTELAIGKPTDALTSFEAAERLGHPTAREQARLCRSLG